MAVDLIITGATGRMGRNLVRMAIEDIRFRLLGVMERAEKLEEAKGFGVPAFSDASALLGQFPGATVVDFTAPEVSLAVARQAAAAGCGMIIGTTGFKPEEVLELNALAITTPLFWSPNMSVGVNALLKVLPALAAALGPEYDLEVMEIHHNKKKDAPSGTALRLGEYLAAARAWPFKESACFCREGLIGERPQEEIGVQSLRGGDVVGVHTVYFLGRGERVELSHHAQSRENFVHGALRAALWLKQMPAGRLYTMQDVLA